MKVSGVNPHELWDRGVHDASERYKERMVSVVFFHFVFNCFFFSVNCVCFHIFACLPVFYAHVKHGIGVQTIQWGNLLFLGSILSS